MKSRSSGGRKRRSMAIHKVRDQGTSTSGSAIATVSAPIATPTGGRCGQAASDPMSSTANKVVNDTITLIPTAPIQ